MPFSQSGMMRIVVILEGKKVDTWQVIVALFAISLTASALATESADALPRDTRIFLTNMENCEHMASEVDNTLPPEALQENINRANRTCKLAKRQYEHLRQKYQGQVSIEHIIAPYGTIMNSAL